MFSSDELVQKKHYNNRVESELAHDVEEYTDKGFVRIQKSKVVRRMHHFPTMPPRASSPKSCFVCTAESVVKCKLLLFLTHSIFMWRRQ